MKPWDIWTCDFAEAGPHPAVIISHPDRVARAPLVNVLIGSSRKASRPARENEDLLNGVDSLDWETLVKCDLTYLVEKERLYQCRGSVGPARRRALVQRPMPVSDSRWSDRFPRRLVPLRAAPAPDQREVLRGKGSGGGSFAMLASSFTADLLALFKRYFPVQIIPSFCSARPAQARRRG